MKAKDELVYDFEKIEYRSNDPYLSSSENMIKRSYEIWRSEGGLVSTFDVCKKMRVRYDLFIRYANERLQMENPKINFPESRPEKQVNFTIDELKMLSNIFCSQEKLTLSDIFKLYESERKDIIELYKKQRANDNAVSRPTEVDW